MASEDISEERSLLGTEPDPYGAEPSLADPSPSRYTVRQRLQALDVEGQSRRIFSDVSGRARRLKLDQCLQGCAAVALLVCLIVISSLLGESIGILKRIEEQTKYLPRSALDENVAFVVQSAQDPVGDQLSFVLTSPADDALLLMEIPVLDLEQPLEAEQPLYLFSAIFDYGSFFDGANQASALLHMPAENTEDTLFAFQLSPDKAFVDVVRVPTNVRSGTLWSEAAVEMSAWPGYVTSLPILDIGLRDGTFLATVEATELVLHGFYITDVDAELLYAYHVDLGRVMSYPRNANCVVEYVFAETPYYPQYALSLFFSVTRLESSAELAPARLWDKRVGYFTTGFYQIGDLRTGDDQGHASDHIDRSVQIINRRDMRRPLIYHIDPSVPPQWRAALCRGVEAWNVAFDQVAAVKDALGGKKAVRCLTPSDAEFPEDYSAGDSRFSSISWAVDLDETYALGPATVDPRNGKIVSSNIVFTNGWLKAWLETIEQETGVSSGRRTQGVEPRLSSARSRAEQARRLVSRNASNPSSRKPAADPRGTPFFEKLQARHGRRHQLHGLQGGCAEALSEHRMSVLDHFHHSTGQRRLQDDGSDPFQQVLEAGLTDVVMHEVGHTLGLRHNFKGSAQRTKEQLKDKDHVHKHGLTSSVMDYLPLNFWSEDFTEPFPPDAPLFTPVIGEYDMWAIKFGYENDSQYQEVFEAEHPFATDEDEPRSAGMDIETSVFDLSSDPIAYYEDQLKFARLLKADAAQRGVLAGEYHTRIEALLKKVQRTMLSSCAYMAKAIGGYVIGKTRKAQDQTNGAPTPVRRTEQSTQDRALSNILDVLLGAEDSDQTAYSGSDTDVAVAVEPNDCPNVVEGYCYGVIPVDPFALVDDRNRQILDVLLGRDRLERIRAQHEAYGGSSVADFLTTVASKLVSGKASNFTEIGDYTASLLIALADRTDPKVSATVANAGFAALQGIDCGDENDRNLICLRIERWLKGSKYN